MGFIIKSGFWLGFVLWIVAGAPDQANMRDAALRQAQAAGAPACLDKAALCLLGAQAALPLLAPAAAAHKDQPARAARQASDSLRPADRAPAWRGPGPAAGQS